MSDEVKNEGSEAGTADGLSPPPASAAQEVSAAAVPAPSETVETPEAAAAVPAPVVGMPASSEAVGTSAVASAPVPPAGMPAVSETLEAPGAATSEATPAAQETPTDGEAAFEEAGEGAGPAATEGVPRTAEAPAGVEAATAAPAAAPAPVSREVLEEKLAEMSGEGARPAEAKWYVVTTYSGFEHKAKQALEERIRKSPFPELFGQVLVPTEPPPEGKKKATGRSFFPGYIFVEMVMNEQTWTLVKGTPRVTNFVGNQKPTPVPAEQIREIQRQISEGAIKAKPEVVFSEGDRVRVSQGPFMNMNGTVSSINPVKQMVRVLVSIFGRATPVELEFHQVEKLP